MQTLKRAKRWTTGYGIISTVICLLVIFYPQPYEVMIGLGLLLPLIGIGLVFKYGGAVCFDNISKSAIPTVGFGLMILTFSMLIRGMTDWKVIDLGPLYLPAIGITLMLLIIIVFADPTLIRRWKQAVTIIIICVMYGGGAVLFLNGYLDSAEPERYSATVFIEKHEGKCHHLMIAPPGPYFDGEQVYVSDKYEQYIKAGDEVVVMVKPGWLGAPRFMLAPADS